MTLRHDYRTVDSQHPAYTVPRSPWAGPLFLLTFAVCSATALVTLPILIDGYIDLLRRITGADVALLPTPPSLSFRPFFTLTGVLLAAFVSASLPERLKLATFVFMSMILSALASDSALFILHERVGGPDPFATAGNITTGFAQMVLLSAIFLSAHELPPTISVPTERRRPLRFAAILTAAVLIAGAAVIAATLAVGDQLDALRNVALLGGLGPGIILFLPTLQLVLFTAAWVDRHRVSARLPRRMGDREHAQRPDPTIAFLIPAHNEAAIVEDCLRSIGRTAVGYPNGCAVYLVDNLSTDGTAEVAERAFEDMPHLRGRVLACDTPGKSHALNLGLHHIVEDIVIRVDADTVVAEDVLARVAMHFSDPDVGGVGGLALPLPAHERTVLGRVRTIEALLNVGMSRVAQTAADSVMVLPGQLSAYRTDLITRLGGFASGINGEDTDLTVRAGRAGWRMVVDPRIHLYSEVPHNFAHLHEQRLRWSRSLIHVYKRNISALWQRQGWRGLWLLPNGLMNAVRRSMVPLLIIYAMLSLTIAPDNLFLRDGTTILAALAGPQIILTTVALLAYRKPWLLPYVPGYMFLRLFRSYLGIEVLLSMRHRSRRVSRRVSRREKYPTLAWMRANAGPASAFMLALPLAAAAIFHGSVFAERYQAVEIVPSPSVSIIGVPTEVTVTPATPTSRWETSQSGSNASLDNRLQRPTVDLPSKRLLEWQRTVDYEVQPGDALATLAENHYTSVGAIVALNSLRDPSFVLYGTTLRIPVGFTEPLEAGYGTSFLPRWPHRLEWRVTSGDTLYALAEAHSTTIEAIAVLNGLRSMDTVFAGQRLTVPVGFQLPLH